MQMPVPSTIVCATLGFVAMCIAVDVRTLRIPNALTGPAILAGIALNSWYFGWAGVVVALTGASLATAFLLGPFALGGIGAGDVKMMAGVGALLGPRLVFESLFLGLALGGVIAVAHLAQKARLREKLITTWHMALNAVLARSLAPLKVSASDPNAVALPYSLPLGLGTAGVIAISTMARA